MPFGRTLAGAGLAAALALLAGCGQGGPRSTHSAAPASGAAAASAAPANPDADSAHAFLADMYSHYGGPGDPPTFTNPSAWFDPPLAALLVADDQRTKAGNEGALEYDPICACQDSGGLKAAIDVTKADPDAATAIATITYPGPPPPDGPSKITFDLVKENGQWRIHDVHEDQAASLLRLLQQAQARSAQPAD